MVVDGTVVSPTSEDGDSVVPVTRGVGVRYKRHEVHGWWVSLKDFFSSYFSYIMLFFPYFRSGKPLM